MAVTDDSTFIDPVRIGSAGTTVAVKDIIDLARLPTTAGCRALERAASLAPRRRLHGPACGRRSMVVRDAAERAGPFAPAAPARVIGRLRVPDVDPTIEAAVDRA